MCHQGYRWRAAKLAAAARALKSASSVNNAHFALAFMTDSRRVPHPELVMRALPPGSAVVMRDYDDPRRRSKAARLAALCRGRGIFFFVGQDAALADAVGADGLHLPSRALRIGSPPHWRGWLTASCHSGEELARAARAGVDIAFLGPAFATESHPGAESLGPEKFKALAREASVPVLALGGVDPDSARLLTGPNVVGLAAIGAFAG